MFDMYVFNGGSCCSSFQFSVVSFCWFFFVASSLCVLFPMFPAPLDCSLLIAPFDFL
jgi:hypothetical protein